jgi:lactoylglutathione lyase
MDVQLNLIVIRSSDIEQSSHFYKLLGLQFSKHRHGNGPEHYACELGNLVFEIYPGQKALDSTKTTRIGFRVTELDMILAKLEENGVEIISRPENSPWGRRAIVSDPDGHRVELTEQN